MKKHLLLLSFAICLFFASCSGVRFGHLAKVKSDHVSNQNSNIKAQKIISYHYSFIDSLENYSVISNQFEVVKNDKNEIINTDVNAIKISKKSFQNILFQTTEISDLSSFAQEKNYHNTENIEPRNIRKMENFANASYILSILGYCFTIFIISVLSMVLSNPLILLFGFAALLAEIFALLLGAESLRFAKENGQEKPWKAKFGIYAASIYLFALLLLIIIK